MPKCGKCGADQTVEQIRACYSARPDAYVSPDGEVARVGSNFFVKDVNQGLFDHHEEEMKTGGGMAGMLSRQLAAQRDVRSGKLEAYKQGMNGTTSVATIEGTQHAFTSEGPTMKQTAFIEKLWNEKAVEDGQRLMPTSKREASSLISLLVEMPAKKYTQDPEALQGTPTSNMGRGKAELDMMVEDGYYAILTVDLEVESANDWVFLKVTNGQTKVFMDLQAGEDMFSVRDHARKMVFLKAISHNPAEASKNYGLKMGRCGVCNRNLTNEDSRALGIGPKCASKMGW